MRTFLYHYSKFNTRNPKRNVCHGKIEHCNSDWAHQNSGDWFSEGIKNKSLVFMRERTDSVQLLFHFLRIFQQEKESGKVHQNRGKKRSNILNQSNCTIKEKIHVATNSCDESCCLFLNIDRLQIISPRFRITVEKIEK